MGKRSNHPRRERDDYATPWRAVAPVLRFLAPGTRFIEPCSGAGELVGHLERAGHVCVASCDLPIDARTTSYSTANAIFVTNPPWRPQFEPHKIIANLSDQRPLWALMYTDWLFTLRATPFLPRLREVVVIGRMKWIEGTKHSGYENCCWCPFDRPRPDASVVIRFHGKARAGRDALLRRHDDAA